MKKDNITLGELIKNKRESLNISQRQLAKMANMDCAELSRIEAGKRKKPNVLFLQGIANALNLSLVELMKLAGYNDVDLIWGKNKEDNRSNKDYDTIINNYKNFYFDVLEDIEIRRKNALECKDILSDLIDRIDNPDFYKDKLTMQEISNKLKEISRTMRPNLNKFDKSKYKIQ